MRNLLALIGAAVVAFVVVGWMLGWYKVKTTTTPQGHRQVNIDLNGPKIKADLARGREQLSGFLEQSSSQPTPPPAPTLMPPALPPSGDGVTIRSVPPGGQVRQGDGRYWFVPRN
ncbi:MAG: hypothetical protein L0Z62_32255 [Gemmataceae bacterium]|nr:hypothetical protein [Gemmataceae bacterium]